MKMGVEEERGKHRLKQRFEVVRKLGHGTYGKVQLAINKDTGQEVAIKTIKKAKIENDQDLVRIRREIQIMSYVQHPHIVHIHEVFENKEKIVLVMQYASGGEMYDYLKSRKSLVETDARRIFRQIVSAVYYCHKNRICHRDLKLENILLDERGNAKIADFGLSNIFSENNFLHTFCGSPLYASPEIVKGKPYYGPEVDCWSLGVLLYTLIYGAMPFDGSNFKSLVKQISEGDYYEPKKKSDASGLIRHLLTVQPAKRATIIDVCNHWWVNLGFEHSLLQVAEDMANFSPVNMDALLNVPQLKTEQNKALENKETSNAKSSSVDNPSGSVKGTNCENESSQHTPNCFSNRLDNILNSNSVSCSDDSLCQSSEPVKGAVALSNEHSSLATNHNIKLLNKAPVESNSSKYNKPKEAEDTASIHYTIVQNTGRIIVKEQFSTSDQKQISQVETSNKTTITNELVHTEQKAINVTIHQNKELQVQNNAQTSHKELQLSESTNMEESAFSTFTIKINQKDSLKNEKFNILTNSSKEIKEKEVSNMTVKDTRESTGINKTELGKIKTGNDGQSSKDEKCSTDVKTSHSIEAKEEFSFNKNLGKNSNQMENSNESIEPNLQKSESEKETDGKTSETAKLANKKIPGKLVIPKFFEESQNSKPKVNIPPRAISDAKKIFEAKPQEKRPYILLTRRVSDARNKFEQKIESHTTSTLPRRASKQGDSLKETSSFSIPKNEQKQSNGQNNHSPKESSPLTDTKEESSCDKSLNEVSLDVRCEKRQFEEPNKDDEIKKTSIKPESSNTSELKNDDSVAKSTGTLNENMNDVLKKCSVGNVISSVECSQKEKNAINDEVSSDFIDSNSSQTTQDGISKSCSNEQNAIKNQLDLPNILQDNSKPLPDPASEPIPASTNEKKDDCNCMCEVTKLTSNTASGISHKIEKQKEELATNNTASGITHRAEKQCDFKNKSCEMKERDATKTKNNENENHLNNEFAAENKMPSNDATSQNESLNPKNVHEPNDRLNTLKDEKISVDLQQNDKTSPVTKNINSLYDEIEMKNLYSSDHKRMHHSKRRHSDTHSFLNATDKYSTFGLRDISDLPESCYNDMLQFLNSRDANRSKYSTSTVLSKHRQTKHPSNKDQQVRIQHWIRSEQINGHSTDKDSSDNDDDFDLHYDYNYPVMNTSNHQQSINELEDKPTTTQHPPKTLRSISEIDYRSMNEIPATNYRYLGLLSNDDVIDNSVEMLNRNVNYGRRNSYSTIYRDSLLLNSSLLHTKNSMLHTPYNVQDDIFGIRTKDTNAAELYGTLHRRPSYHLDNKKTPEMTTDMFPDRSLNRKSMQCLQNRNMAKETYSVGRMKHNYTRSLSSNIPNQFENNSPKYLSRDGMVSDVENLFNKENSKISPTENDNYRRLMKNRYSVSTNYCGKSRPFNNVSEIYPLSVKGVVKNSDDLENPEIARLQSLRKSSYSTYNRSEMTRKLSQGLSNISKSEFSLSQEEKVKSPVQEHASSISDQNLSLCHEKYKNVITSQSLSATQSQIDVSKVPSLSLLEALKLRGYRNLISQNANYINFNDERPVTTNKTYGDNISTPKCETESARTIINHAEKGQQELQEKPNPETETVNHERCISSPENTNLQENMIYGERENKKLLAPVSEANELSNCNSDQEESVSERIWRKSFYSRFNDVRSRKKKPYRDGDVTTQSLSGSNWNVVSEENFRDELLSLRRSSLTSGNNCWSTLPRSGTKGVSKSHPAGGDIFNPVFHHSDSMTNNNSVVKSRCPKTGRRSSLDVVEDCSEDSASNSLPYCNETQQSNRDILTDCHLPYSTASIGINSYSKFYGPLKSVSAYDGHSWRDSIKSGINSHSTLSRRRYSALDSYLFTSKSPSLSDSVASTLDTNDPESEELS